MNNPDQTGEATQPGQPTPDGESPNPQPNKLEEWKNQMAQSKRTVEDINAERRERRETLNKKFRQRLGSYRSQRDKNERGIKRKIDHYFGPGKQTLKNQLDAVDED